MKKSELTFTGDVYRLTPDRWVEIATANNKFYAVLHSQKKRTDGWTPELIRECQNPDEAQYGAASIYGNQWEHFERE